MMIRNLQILLSAFAGALLALTLADPDAARPTLAGARLRPAAIPIGNVDDPAVAVDLERLVGAVVCALEALDTAVPVVNRCVAARVTLPPDAPF